MISPLDACVMTLNTGYQVVIKWNTCDYLGNQLFLRPKFTNRQAIDKCINDLLQRLKYIVVWTTSKL